MTLSSVRATFGLSATATPTKSGSTGTIQIGDGTETIRLTAATKIVSFDAVIAGGSSSSLIIDVSDLDSTGSTAWTAGTAQVETTTIVAAGGATSNGNMTLVVTSAGMAGSPKNVVVPLTTAAHTSADLIATAARTALAADTAVGGRFTIGGTGANLTLTRKPTSTYTVNGTTVPVYPANDATANLAIPGVLGITADSTSTDTTAGVATAGAYAPDLDGTDFEGEATGGLVSIHAFSLKNHSTSPAEANITDSLNALLNFPIFPGSTFQIAGLAAAVVINDFTITPETVGDQSCHITVTIAGA